MPHRRTPWLTTPSHPFVLAFYVALMVLGVIGLTTNLLNPESMKQEFGDAATRIWALTRFLAGAAALTGAVGATVSLVRFRDPRFHLWIEFVGCLLIVGSQGFYEYTLFRRFEFYGVIETQMYAIAFTIAGLVRAIQLPFQIRLWKTTQRRE